MDEWYSLYTGGTGETEEKKSRFIATITPVSSEEEAVQFIASIKKQYWDARHNCSAFIIGDKGQKSRCSDDGEPSGTAGRPMLDVLMNEHITNACVVVTRYFGGTLLGTGGLVRAYSAAVKEGLKNCGIIKKISGYRINTGCDYNDLGKIQHSLSGSDVCITDITYNESVRFSLIAEDAEGLMRKVTDLTNGRAVFDEPEEICFAMINGEPVIFRQQE